MNIGPDVDTVHTLALIDDLVEEDEGIVCQVCGVPLDDDDENELCAECEDIFDTSEFSEPDIEWSDARLLAFAEWFGYNIEPNPDSTLGYSVTSPSGKRLGGFVAKRIIAAYQKNPDAKKDGAKPPKAGGKGKSGGGGSGGKGGGAKAKSGGGAAKSGGGAAKSGGSASGETKEKAANTRSVKKRLPADQGTVDMIGRLDDAARDEFWKANASLAKDLAAAGFTVEEDGSVTVAADGVGKVSEGFNSKLAQMGVTSHLSDEEKAVAKVAKKQADAAKKLADSKMRAADSIAAINPAGMEETTKGRVKSAEVQAIIDRHQAAIEGATDPKAVAAAIKTMKEEIAAYKKVATAPPTEAQALASTIQKLQTSLPRGVDIEAPNLPVDQAQSIIDSYREKLASAPDAEAARLIIKDMRNEIRNTKEANSAAAAKAKADTAAIQKAAKTTAAAQKEAKAKGWEPQEVVKPKDATERAMYQKAVEAKAATDPDFMYSVIESGDGTLTVIKKPKSETDDAAKLSMALEKLAAKGTTIPPEVTAFLQQNGILKPSAMKSAPLPSPAEPVQSPASDAPVEPGPAPVAEDTPAEVPARSARGGTDKDARPNPRRRERRQSKQPITAAEWAAYYADEFDPEAQTFGEDYVDLNLPCYVVMVPDEATRKAIALTGGEAADILHMTLAYFDEGLKARDFGYIEELARYRPPLQGTISGLGRFHAEDKDAIIALPDVPDLPGVRERLCGNGTKPSQEHGFTPHITLKYVKPNAATPRVSWRTLPVKFDAIEVWQKDGPRMRFPFLNEPDPYGLPAAYREVADASPFDFAQSRHPAGTREGGRFAKGGGATGAAGGGAGRIGGAADADALMANAAEIYSVPEKGIHVKVDYRSGSSVSLIIEDADGKEIGEMDRTFRDGKVTHTVFKLKSAKQGEGIAAAINKKAEEAYLDHGFTQIELNADISVGKYAWARQGYDFKHSASALAGYEMLGASMLGGGVKGKQAIGKAMNGKKHAWEIAAMDDGKKYPLPGGGEGHLGKALMLHGTSWDGVKDISPGSPGRKIGDAYYASKGL